MRRLVCGFVLLACLAVVAHAAGPPPAQPSILESVEFGGTVELAYERLHNFDLDRAEADNVDLLPFELKLELLFAPNEHFELYFQPTLLREFELRERAEGATRQTQLLIEEAYVTLAEPEFGVSLQVGRQTFEDDRQWLYDAELDAIRGLYRARDFALELSASRQALFREDLLTSVEEEPVNNYLVNAAYGLDEEVTVGAYGLVFDHRTAERDPVFIGLYSLGRLGDRLSYWLNAAHVRGREEGTRLRGFGVDVLATYSFDLPLSPYLILGYAFGSGDPDPDDDRDGAFRQTGLQGNEAEVGGLTPFSYYGEAFDPELSNLSIFTAGLGARPREGISIDLVYHHYLQDEASGELGDSAFDAEPSGQNRRLGSEIDLVLGIEEIEDFRIGGFLGYFVPGRAFPGGEDALFARIELEYGF